ncbi:MAG: TauD/TfdA family dioxygenase [Alphaproteobacteria bacterium]
MSTIELPRAYTGPMAWRADTLPPNAGVIHLDAKAQAELAATADLLLANPLATEALDLSDFEIPACKAAMSAARAALDHGLGFAVIDRLDVSNREIATKLYWLLMSMTAPLVAQKHDGTMVYDVVDNGAATAPGNGVRASKTSQRQGFHTDNAFNMPPDYVALCCLQTAKEGGLSGLISFQTVYNRLIAEESPEVAARMFEPFWFDRQLEHGPDESPLTRHPAFWPHPEGGIDIAFSPRLVRQGAAVHGEPLDEQAEAALSAIARITEDEALAFSFEFEPGQIQIVNNKRLGHRRTAFVDWPDADRRRHLVRLWMRNEGRPFYGG